MKAAAIAYASHRHGTIPFAVRTESGDGSHPYGKETLRGVAQRLLKGL